jgi:hypothetical protein
VNGDYGYDPVEREEAARLQEANPLWLIMWGVHSRLLWAFPLFHAPRGTVVSASSPDRLLDRMRQVELSARGGRGPTGRLG